MSTQGPGSPSPEDPNLPPNPRPSIQAVTGPTQSSTNPRRLPPPCWSHDETVELIDAYRDKWYALRRGNLKANHWQEVADAIARRCPEASPAKTAVQCRHKMEKLRKRYRTEIQRARSMPVSRFTSAWVHFKRLDSMEKGPQAKPDFISESDNEDNEDDNEDDDDTNPGFYPDGYRNGTNILNTRSLQKMYRNGIRNPGTIVNASGAVFAGAAGFRIRIPTGVSIAQPAPTKFYAKAAETKYAANPPNMGANTGVNQSYGGMGSSSSRVARSGVAEESGKKREREPMEEMVAAIKVLGDGFASMEQMKMEMAKEMETMRMEMELKRTEMILESQQRIVEAFVSSFSEKKLKRVPSPESQTGVV